MIAHAFTLSRIRYDNKLFVECGDCGEYIDLKKQLIFTTNADKKKLRRTHHKNS